MSRFAASFDYEAHQQRMKQIGQKANAEVAARRAAAAVEKLPKPKKQASARLISKDSIQTAQLTATIEASVQEAILGYLRAQRIPHTITEAKRSFNQRGQQVARVKRGWPDLTACYSGAFVAIECKRPVGGRLSLIQAIELDALVKAGALVVIARSLGDVVELFDTEQTSDATINEISTVLKKGMK